MNIVDIVILIFLAFGALIGFKRGFTRELVSLIGIFAILLLSFILKNPVSVFFYNTFPFINFGGIFKDITVLNILMYEILAFLIIFFILTIIFKILLTLTKIFEKILTATIILGIPSKILGAVLGIVQSLIYVFITLYILNLPIINFEPVKESNVGNKILNKTPILTNVCDSTLSVFNEVLELKEEYETTNNVDEFNKKALEAMIDKNIITKENAKELIKKGKIKNIVID